MLQKITSRIGVLVAMFIAMPVFYSISYAQSPPGYTEGILWKGEPGIKTTLEQIVAKEAWMKANGLLKKQKNKRVDNNEKALLKQKLMNPESPAVSIYGESKPQAKTASTDFNITLAFDGLKASDITQGWAPPDPMMAVGPKQIVLVVNGRIRVFDKTNGALQYDVDADVFFNDVRGSSNVVDPRVVYDPLSQRWFIVSITNSFQNNRITIAVSSSAVLTQQSTVTLFFFQQNKVGPTPNDDSGLFADYETLGVDGAALYMGCNMFNSTLHTSLFVVNKADLISGTLSVTAFRNVGSSGNGGPWTAQGVSNSTVVNPTEGYFIGTDYDLQGRLVMRKILNPGGVPSISPNINLTVPTTAIPLDAPNKNGFPLDAIDTRLLQATLSKDESTGVVSLWTSHSILVNKTGVGTSSGDRNGVRWYEIGNLNTATPTLVQSGTLFDAVSITKPKFYWMGTISMNKRGNAMISCTVSSKDTGANGTVAMHFNDGLAGNTSAPKNTTQTNTAYFGGRWGDYSTSTVDPVDNTTFWGVHEYMGASEYTIRVVRVKATNTVNGVVENDQDADVTLFSFSTYPNPATDKVHIVLNTIMEKPFAMSITNHTGQIVSYKTIAAGAKEWDENISSLQQGIYWVTITSVDGYQSHTIQLKKD
mgnify:CR=1 FL=1